MTYAQKLKDPRWQKKRLAVLERDEWTCSLCGDSETCLHVHHKSYRNNPWESPIDDLISYCEHCHCVIEYIKRNNIKLASLSALKTSLSKSTRIFVLCNSHCEGNHFSVLVFDYQDGEVCLVISIDEEIFKTIAHGISVIGGK